jgi:hypothetical protein
VACHRDESTLLIHLTVMIGATDHLLIIYVSKPYNLNMKIHMHAAFLLHSVALNMAATVLLMCATQNGLGWPGPHP